ncbi:Rrf2 family transcriptional regulator [Oceanobacillus neutriphilus]|uniref:Transcriptional regulator n=1 Tax=Oceanobacillus neutriphilus TaxID=531815 RepID=A0ABQ2NQW3_9BACI|nr:Rrf2 family transcriptional regulator [Oceanobacillus neutriphilus]GGP08440.1 transcriptional regulator [Oceanobacillus neutriphilus]
MKYSTKFGDAIHILSYIHLSKNKDLSSKAIAQSINTHPTYVRQIMSSLKKGGLLISVHGHPNPSLAREPEMVSLFDIYKSVEGKKQILQWGTQTNPDCIIGCNIQKITASYFQKIQYSTEQKMKQIHLSDLLHSIAEVQQDDTNELQNFWLVNVEDVD